MNNTNILYNHTIRQMNEYNMRKYYKNFRSKENDVKRYKLGVFLKNILKNGNIDEKSDVYEYMELNIRQRIKKEQQKRITPQLIGEILTVEELQKIAETFIFNVYE